MRRRDREMPGDFALAVADKCEWAALAMTDGGMPYCVPVSIARDGGHIYFHAAKTGRKTDCLRRNPKVCLVCVGDTRRSENEFTTEYESAIISGQAGEVEDDGEKVHALRLLAQRHCPANMDNFDAEIARSLKITAVWKIRIEEISGKRKKFDANGEEMKFGRME